MNRAFLRTALVAAAAAAALTLSACAGSAAPSIEGVWGDPDAEGKPSLEFQADGTYAGTHGCNRVGGDYTQKDDAVDLGMMRSTMMYCEGVDTWLVTATEATLTADELVFRDAEGTEIGTLPRHDR
mgnify:FL=1